MAFVYKAERKLVALDIETAKLSNIGPGSYTNISNMVKQ